uniref:MULE transposase domain-containing protein n=1 Tax=Lactuca sativa TaxID=4236 RepID=A0A9R1V1V9_LACSA|nr:hypothetical protein LSAT_V11C700373640 [Lactuca sativa]
MTVRAFQTCLCPIIIIDGSHLKRKYLGMMFVATNMYGNNQILLIAFGVGKTESRESCIWFLSRLKECIGDMPSLAIILDIVDSIEMVIQVVFPNAYHKLCCHHLLMNMITKIDKQERTKILFWEDAKDYRQLRRALNEDYRTWLEIIGYEKWARSYFLVVRYNIMTSKNAKSINSLSIDAQKLQITMLIDFFRATMQQWWCQRRKC